MAKLLCTPTEEHGKLAPTVDIFGQINISAPKFHFIHFFIFRSNSPLCPHVK